MTIFNLRTAQGDNFAQFKRPVVVANDNQEGPSPEWRRKWLQAQRHGAFDDDNGKPRQPSPAWDALLPEPANDNEPTPTGAAIASYSIMKMAKQGKLAAGAVEAIEWLEGVLERAIEDPGAIPSASWLLMPEDIEASYDEITGWSLPDGYDTDREPVYGPTPQWWGLNGGKVTEVKRARHTEAEEGESKAGRILGVQIDGGFWLSTTERSGRIKGARRPEKIEPRPGQLPGENDPAIAWTRVCHRTGDPGMPPIPTPPAHYSGVAKRRIKELREKLGDKALSVLIRAVLLRETAKEIGIAPKVSHSRATAKGGEAIKAAVDWLVDYYFDKIAA